MPTGHDSLIVTLTGPDVRPITVPAPDDLRFSSATQVGYDQASFTLRLNTAAWATPQAIRALSTVRVVDRRTGGTVWWGRIDDPGLAADRDGSSWQVTASGPGHELTRILKQIVYVDRDPASWRPMNQWPAGKPSLLQGANGLVAHSGDPLAIAPASVWEQPFPGNSKVVGGAVSALTYDRPKFSTGDTVRVVAVLGSHKASFASSAITLDMLVRNGAGTASAVSTWNSAATQVDFTRQQGVSWAATDIVEVLLRWVNVSTTQTFGDDPQWHHWGNLVVLAQRYLLDGTALTPAAHGWTISPREIVADLIGHHLDGVVTAGQFSTDDTGDIDHAAWWTGTSLADVLDFVSQRDNGKRWWGVWHPETGGDLPRMDWTEWTGQRYVIPSPQAPRLAGGGDDIANNARVIYTPAEGGIGSVNVTGSVAELDDAGLTRSTLVDATGKGIISVSQATAIGSAALAAANLARTSGTITVTGPILDADTGRVVRPWEIRPGATILVSATPQKFTSAYSDGTPDGVSVFRLTGVAYSASTNTADLSLDGGGRSLITRVRRDVRSPRGRRFAP